MSIYLDNAATTCVCPEAAEAAVNAMRTVYGNPSSGHAAGREAKHLLDASRETVTAALGCTAREVYFTSCGTESDNWALVRGAEKASHVGRHIISSAAEHEAVLKPLEYLAAHGFEVTLLKPRADGAIAPEDVAAALRADTCLVSLMMVNNETGAVTDIAAVAAALKAVGSKALLHTDAVQGFLHVPFAAAKLGADLISVSGHKIHAPKGVGALYIRQGVRLNPYLMGGGQESGLRSGTEAMPQIAAFAAAVKAAQGSAEADRGRVARLRQAAAERLCAENPDIVIIGGGAPHILCFSLPGYRSEVIMNVLESKGIFVSKGSACKKGRRSHVLEAMGLPARVIDGAVRVSLSRFTTESEMDALCSAVSEARRTVRAALR